MASVTPQQIYQALINSGASTVQAIGIMANMINESSLNPEAVGDQGTSFGLVQQHGMQYATLVSNNPPADMAAQIKVLAQNGGISAASGSTGGQAAGNFAANYERCVGCQAGGDQYNQRVANAATVAGWVSSGKWPTSAGSASASAAAAPSAGGNVTNSSDPACAFGLKGGLPVVGSIGLCLVKKTTIRHLVGGFLLAGGGIVVIAGAAILAASAFRGSGAERAVSQVVQVTPGAGRAVAAAKRAPVARRQRRAAAGREQQRQITAGNREARRAAGTPRNQARAVRGEAPRRPNPATQQRPRPPREVHH